MTKTPALFGICVLASIIFAEQAQAAPVTCDEFKVALTQAVVENGHKVAYPGGYSVAYKRDDGTLTRYKWAGIVGLSGELFCGPEDAFDTFSIKSYRMLGNPDAKAITERFKELAATALAAADGTPYKDSMVATLKTLKSAQREQLAAHKRGEFDPSGNDYSETANGGQVNITVNADSYSAAISPPLPN